jgi:hypothetical protein
MGSLGGEVGSVSSQNVEPDLEPAGDGRVLAGSDDREGGA